MQLAHDGSNIIGVVSAFLDPPVPDLLNLTRHCCGALSLLCGTIIRGCPVYADEAALEPWTRCGLFRGGVPDNCTATWAERCTLTMNYDGAALGTVLSDREGLVMVEAVSTAHAAIAARLLTVTPHDDDACAVAPTELGVRLHTWLQAPSKLSRSARVVAERKTRLACEVRVCVP